MSSMWLPYPQTGGKAVRQFGGRGDWVEETDDISA